MKNNVKYNYIVTNPKISSSQLAQKLKINESAVQKYFDILKNKGLIEIKVFLYASIERNSFDSSRSWLIM